MIKKKGRFELFDYIILAIIITNIFFDLFLLAFWNEYKSGTSNKNTNCVESEIEESQENSMVMENEFSMQINEIWVVKATGMNYVDCSLEEEIQDYVYYMCEKYGVEFELIMAQMKIESDYNSSLISSTNDYGLMQINICNHQWLSNALGITDFLDEKQNVKAGIFVMKNLIDKCDGNITKALMSYNMGYEVANYLWNNGEYSTDYTIKIQKEYERILGEND